MSDQRLRKYREIYLQAAASEYERLMSFAESPIEALVLADFVDVYVVHPTEYELPDELCEVVDEAMGPVDRRTAEWAAAMRSVWPAFSEAFTPRSAFAPQFQVQIGALRYRLDLAILGRGYRLCVEFDGHDFHERTKEQATRDKTRDRALVREGWTVLRYTGLEVYRDPNAVVFDICGHRHRLANAARKASR